MKSEEKMFHFLEEGTEELARVELVVGLTDLACSVLTLVSMVATVVE